jgi:hypothetical protein
MVKKGVDAHHAWYAAAGEIDRDLPALVQLDRSAMAKYLTCYDYGQGGIWLYVEGDSPSQIRGTYRDLTVFEIPPPWWTDELDREVRPQEGPFWENWLAQFRR